MSTGGGWISLAAAAAGLYTVWHTSSPTDQEALRQAIRHVLEKRQQKRIQYNREKEEHIAFAKRFLLNDLKNGIAQLYETGKKVDPAPEHRKLIVQCSGYDDHFIFLNQADDSLSKLKKIILSRLGNPQGQQVSCVSLVPRDKTADRTGDIGMPLVRDEDVSLLKDGDLLLVELSALT